MTDIFLAMAGPWTKTFPHWPFEEEPVNLLFTFADKSILAARQQLSPARAMLDSGAFSAWNRGATIDLDALIEETKRPVWTESVCLDVIGDADASMKNALAMRARGSPAFPVFHIGDPWEHLEEYKRVFGRVGLSCRFGEPPTHSLRWLEQCFARAWPCRFHSFGWTAAEALSRFPFDTADSTSWMNPQAYGQSRAFARAHSTAGIGLPGVASLNARKLKDLSFEVRAFLKTQRFLQFKWEKELRECRRDSSASRSTNRPSS